MEVLHGDVVGGHIHGALFDAVQHDDHDDRPRRGVI
jgi:hypothetical protein